MQAITTRPIFRARPIDQANAATIAKTIEATGANPTPTAILRHALAVAAVVAASATRDEARSA